MMTQGQERALLELKRLHAADPHGFELIGSPQIVDGGLEISISLLLGPMETRQGGLDLREREDFILIIPPDFPFDYPVLKVVHDRFAGFPHVVWSKYLCLYQSKIEWNPTDGLFGFFDRLKIWIERAAINDMDPVDGPLEPPHHITDFSQLPFVIRSNAPVEPGASWFGLAKLKKFQNRIELIGWDDVTGGWPQDSDLALAVFLPKPLPMEFPKNGADFFKELLKQGLTQDRIIKNLALASLFISEGEPVHLVLGIPMRRAVDGSTRIHIAVWTTDSDFSKYLRSVLPQGTDTDSIRSLRQEIADSLYSYFEKTQIKWCKVLEDRNEIVVRRDIGCPVEWFRDKKVLILGCGALGSWAAEIIARANPNLIHLVDNSIVKPGLLTRQNYRLEDIGSNKAKALADKLQTIMQNNSISFFPREAYDFIMDDKDRFGSYDIVLDCTASDIFQMKLERDWGILNGRTPPIISVVIDAKAQSCLSVVICPSSGGGVWDAYVQLKHRLCVDPNSREIASAFYTQRSIKELFQPEPGCSDPTFSGSTADVVGLISTVLNLAICHAGGNYPVGILFSTHNQNGRPGELSVIRLSSIQDVKVGNYRVRIDGNVFCEERAWVKQNNRLRSSEHETGGLLWGLWDEAVNTIWVFDISGPPSDSIHDPGNFVCGVEGTIEEHNRRVELTHGGCGFLGFWHTHPDMPSKQSMIDMGSMATLVSKFGQNQKRSLMLIFGRKRKYGTVGIYAYQSHTILGSEDIILIEEVQIKLEN